eukprot:TRINITY_DN6300_c0_g1_i1.p1 TRINITY_DN6300_c0_g1~~TRINITY_DN6300_c0_g1_i1.p1  ORF type:complete len:256 (+),score=34.84 TRINITY_DN6300_c0_g1_i1:340-1107(+)
MSQQGQDLVSSSGLRLDGRGCEQIRGDYSMRTGILSKASGSAYVELGSTKVTVSINGPKPPDGKDTFKEAATLNVRVSSTTFSSRKTRLPGHTALHKDPEANRRKLEQHKLRECLEEALSTIILLESYPKSSIEVNALILESDGADTVAILMAAGLAACDAGIDMRCILTAATVVTAGRHMLLDPTLAEEDVAERYVTVAMNSDRQQIAYVDVSGIFSASELTNAMELAISACAFYAPSLRETLLDGLGDEAMQE